MNILVRTAIYTTSNLTIIISGDKLGSRVVEVFGGTLAKNIANLWKLEQADFDPSFYDPRKGFLLHHISSASCRPNGAFLSWTNWQNRGLNNLQNFTTS